jgi:hypothetical protein
MAQLIIKIFKITALALAAMILLFGVWFYNMFIVSPLDRPWIESGYEETITVDYVNWACDCAEFVETKNVKQNRIADPKPEHWIFIEPSRPELKLTEEFRSEKHYYNYLRLTGHFYLDKGIPKSYAMKTPEKPEHAKVFRYTKMEFINKP